MPYPKIFGFLENYAIELGGTSGSLGTQPYRTNFVATDGSKVAPAICYESIYGDFMSGYMRDSAQFIAVITNDGWWENTPGYRQHMNYARILAIEFRKVLLVLQIQESVASSINAAMFHNLLNGGWKMLFTEKFIETRPSLFMPAMEILSVLFALF